MSLQKSKNNAKTQNIIAILAEFVICALKKLSSILDIR